MSKRQEIENIIGEGRVKEGVVLAPHTTLKMGGWAEFYCEVFTKEDIIKSITASAQCGLKFTFLGGASNVAITDHPIKGLVVRNFFKEKKIIKKEGDTVIMRVSSGYPVNLLVREMVKDGLSGLEYHLGLPGTVGGALYMNSKWTHPVSYIGDNLIEAEVVDLVGHVKTVDRNYFQFGYDVSILQKTKDIVLTADFLLTKMNKNVLKKRADEALSYRRKTQPQGVATAGCFFKNVDGASAGKMIDELGLKGISVGDFFVSEKHGNFIINRGVGTTKDLQTLVSLIKDKVKTAYHKELEEEVVFIQ